MPGANRIETSSLDHKDRRPKLTHSDVQISAVHSGVGPVAGACIGSRRTDFQVARGPPLMPHLATITARTRTAWSGLACREARGSA
jgi:hypothetical protein